MKMARVSEQDKDLRVSAGVDTHSHLIREPVKVLTLNVMTNRVAFTSPAIALYVNH